MALGLVVIAVGASWRLFIAIKPVPECSPPGGPLPASPITAQVVADTLATSNFRFGAAGDITHLVTTSDAPAEALAIFDDEGVDVTLV